MLVSDNAMPWEGECSCQPMHIFVSQCMLLSANEFYRQPMNVISGLLSDNAMPLEGSAGRETSNPAAPLGACRLFVESAHFFFFLLLSHKREHTYAAPLGPVGLSRKR